VNEKADLLRRIERRALWIAAALAAIVLLIPGARLSVAAGVFGGALVSAVSYWAIKHGVGGLTTAVAGGANPRGHAARGLVMLVGRYALLALIAYVMIARLRLSPMGLLLGASVIPAAVSIEALGVLRKHGKV
jgi:hypothetical protein